VAGHALRGSLASPRTGVHGGGAGNARVGRGSGWTSGLGALVEQRRAVDWRYVTPEYFRLFRIPVRAGRVFDARDEAHGAPVALVNEAFARTYFGTAQVVGRFVQVVRNLEDPPREIVGGCGRQRPVWFGSLAFATVGIYGLLAYSATQRTQEVGIRMALGATSVRVLRAFLVEGLSLVLIGVTMGLCGAALASRLVSSLIFGVAPLDPLTFAAVSAVLILVAGTATLIPALQASRTDPMSALRLE
jgi:FtsX-like permease family protein/MacB-like protein